MLHFPIFKTSLDSLGLGFLESEPRGRGRAEAGASPPRRPQEGKQRNYCEATVEQLLVLRGTICGTIKRISHQVDGVNVS